MSSDVEFLQGGSSGGGGSGITQLTGDVVAGPGSGAQAAQVVAGHFGGADGQYLKRVTGLWVPANIAYADVSGTPSSLPPNGAAGGDLGGTYPSPTVVGGTHITSEVTGADFKPSGLTGATAASRYVGATASGHPTTGTFAVGDFVLDQTGAMWVCTVAGTPGTWVEIVAGGGTASALTNGANSFTLNSDGTLSSVGGGPTLTSVNAGFTSVTFGPKSALVMIVYLSVAGASIVANALLFNLHFSTALANVPKYVGIQAFMDATATHAPVAGFYYDNTPTTSDIPIFSTSAQAASSVYGIRVIIVL